MSSFCKHLKEEYFSALFIASLVFILHHTTNVFMPFDSAALHLNTAFSKKTDLESQNTLTHRGPFVWMELESKSDHKYSPVLLTYDQSTYENSFKGMSPLDRCVLNDNLLDVLKLNPKVLAIDLDLSPLKNPDKHYKICQDILDRTLDTYANKFVLIHPIPNRQMETDETTQKWLIDRRRSGIVFANPKIESSLGIVINTSPYEDSLAKNIANKIGDPHHHFDIENLKSEHKNPINYLEAGPFRILSINDQATISNRPVFIGGTFGIDDYYLTPIGENIPGVMIHAYDFFSAFEPVKTHGWTNVWALLLDVATAIIVGFAMTYIWSKYLIIINKNKDYSFLAFIAVMLILAIFMLVGMVISVIFLKMNIWISPIPILIAVFFDGIISALINQSLSEKEKEKEKESCYVIISYRSAINFIKRLVSKPYNKMKIFNDFIMLFVIILACYMIFNSFTIHH